MRGSAMVCAKVAIIPGPAECPYTRTTRPSTSEAKSPPAAISGTSTPMSALPSDEVSAMRLPPNVANPFGTARVRVRDAAYGSAESMNPLSCLPASSNNIRRSVPDGVPHDMSRRLLFVAREGAAKPPSAPSSVLDADTTPAVSTVESSMRSPGKRPDPGAIVSRHVTKKVFPLQTTAGAAWRDELGVSAGIAPDAMVLPSLLMSAKRTTPEADCHVASHSFPSNATDGALPAASGKVAMTPLLASSKIVIRIFVDSAGPSSHSDMVRPRPAAIAGDV